MAASVFAFGIYAPADNPVARIIARDSLNHLLFGKPAKAFDQPKNRVERPHQGGDAFRSWQHQRD
jgi:hypothetical protein